MVWKSSEAEERCESAVILHPVCKDSKPRNVSELAGQDKLQDLGLGTSKKTRKGHSDGVTVIAPPRRRNPFEGSVQRARVVGETTAETMSLLSASVENYRPDNSVLAGHKQVPGVSSFQFHVLAVDDSRVDQRVIEKLLKTSSYKVTTVNSALRALEVLGLSDSSPSSFKHLDINLIMTDYCMPDMTGYDLLKRVKAKTSALKEIPVVVMSSENDSNRIQRCLAEGAEEFIIKPVQMSDVKRLRGHIRCSSTTSSSGTGESLGSTCGKRKVDPSDDQHEVFSPERRPRLSELLVT